MRAKCIDSARVRNPRVPTYAQQMVRPFIAALRGYPQIPSALLDQAAAAPEERRVPVPRALALLQAAVDLTQEPDLGLLAASKTERGSLEALEYVVFSAPSWRAALEMVFRYSRLMNEAADFRLFGDQWIAIRDLQAELFLEARDRSGQVMRREHDLSNAYRHEF